MNILTLREKIFRTYVRKDFSPLKTDFHSHLIPGLDDGADTIIDSLVMLKSLRKLGFKKIITTPHIKGERFPNSKEIILKGAAQLRKTIRKNKIDLQFEVAAEYLLDDSFMKLLEENQVLTFGKNHVLVELPFLEEDYNHEEYIFKLKMKKYIPILAHPERYVYWFEDLNRYSRLKQMGCEFQVNILSFTGYYGNEVKRAAQVLFKNDMIDYLCTDLHNIHQLDEINQFVKTRTFAKIITAKKYQNKFH